MAPFIPTLTNLLSVAFNGVRKGRKDLNTVQHHDMHHRYPAKHFSLYFVHWDRFCGTLHPGYEASIFSYFPDDARRGVSTQGLNNEGQLGIPRSRKGIHPASTEGTQQGQAETCKRAGTGA
jgi:hypothetical protein